MFPTWVIRVEDCKSSAQDPIVALAGAANLSTGISLGADELMSNYNKCCHDGCQRNGPLTVEMQYAKL